MLTRRTGRFSHVVFADAVNGSSRALNFAPAKTEDEVPSDALSSDESSFVRWLFNQAGLDARHYRDESVSRRLPACLRTLHVGSIGQARGAIQRSPGLLPMAISAMVIGVTSFFRDADVFAALAEKVIPHLLERRTAGSPLRIWSVGCSDGAELYSVAMLLAESRMLRTPQAEIQFHLLGTDCRADATRHATAGVYDAAGLRGVPPARLSQHFESITNPAEWDVRPDARTAWRVRPELRRMTQWRTANMLTTTEPGSWDLILCRNAAMYMRSSAASVLWERMESVLSPGGFLVLGKAERPGSTSRLSSVGPCLYRREAK